MSRRSLYWIVPLLYAAVILTHGALIGLTDDEAYYWVLAQKPALGYAYHPPAVAWVIAAAQGALGWLFGTHSEFLVRLPGVLCMAFTLGLALRWLLDTGADEKRLGAASLVLLSFAGIFSLSWMMVPDLPLFFGWMLLFFATWRYCFVRQGWQELGVMIFSTTLMMLSKYSGVLAVASAAMAVWIWAPRDKTATCRRDHGIAALLVGFLLGVLPALIWNAQHEWSSLLYQIRDRHGGGSISFVRWVRFFVIEMVAAGPWVLAFAGWIVFRGIRAKNLPYRYLALWMLPAAAVFCVQPLLSDFKPHWAFIVWWPAVIGLAWAVARGEFAGWARWQRGYGLGLGTLVLVSCHLPLGGFVMGKLGKSFDPRWDVTNDLYGWSELESFLKLKLGDEALQYPIVGGWYQTASQAAFAVRSHRRVGLLPLDVKARDEWPDLKISETLGPEWPRLNSKVLFVADNRYGAGPGFGGAKCDPVGTLESKRFGFEAKSISVWRCEPEGARP